MSCPCPDPAALTMPEADRAYLAGVLDGEGCLGISSRLDRRSCQARVSVANTGEPLLRWLRHATGLGSVRYQESRSLRHKPQWVWKVVSLQAVAVVRAALPYLLLKRQQGLALLAFQKAVDVRDYPGQRAYYLTLKDLNRRGVPGEGLVPA